MLARLLGDDAPHVTLAVPGYIGQQPTDAALPGTGPLWIDDAADARRDSVWASERPKRYLASWVAIGTIDQVLEDRYRGFLSSVMPELAPGVHTGPRLSKGVRERVWRVLSDWHATLRRGSILMTWRETTAPGGQAVLSLGEPRRDLVDVDGVLLVRRESGQT